jgi:hypothetical protein
MQIHLGAPLAAALVLAGTALAQNEFGTEELGLPGRRGERATTGFSFARTGDGRPGEWVVRLDAGAPAGDHVLAQVDADDADYRFQVAVADAPVLRDLRLDVGCKPVSGKTDRACGLVFRYRDENHYYVARANALGDNVRLYHVVKGRRRQIGGWNGKVASGTWHALAVEARGDNLQVFWEGKRVIRIADDTFREAGKVGLWTKADSVTWFDALSATPLP